MCYTIWYMNQSLTSTVNFLHDQIQWDMKLIQRSTGTTPEEFYHTLHAWWLSKNTIYQAMKQPYPQWCSFVSQMREFFSSPQKQHFTWGAVLMFLLDYKRQHHIPNNHTEWIAQIPWAWRTKYSNLYNDAVAVFGVSLYVVMDYLDQHV